MTGKVYKYTIKHKDGTENKMYRVMYQYKNSGGKYMEKQKRGFKLKSEAQAFLSKLINDYNTNNFVDQSNITVESYAKSWLQRQINIKPTTYAGYKVNIYNHLIPALGNIKLQSLSVIDIEDFYQSEIKKDFSSTTVLYIHRVLRHALKDAVNRGLISKNPADMVDAPRKAAYNRCFYTKDELAKLLERLSNNELYPAVFLASMLGLRRGEICGLTWDKFDFDNNTVFINQQLVYINKKLEVTTPKTKTSIRRLPFNDCVKNTILQIKKHQSELLDRFGYQNSSNSVITNFEGKMVNPSIISNRFKDFLQKNNLEHIRFHDLRGSYATLVANKAPIKTVQSLLGHGSIRTTEIYVSLIPETMVQANIAYQDDMLK